MLLLTAFILLVTLALRIVKKRVVWLLLYFAIITAILSIFSYFIFHLTLVVLLSMIVHHFFCNSKLHPSKTANMVFYAFLLLLLSQMVFIFNLLNKNLYVVGEVFQLAGYVVLLVTYIMVLKK